MVRIFLFGFFIVINFSCDVEDTTPRLNDIEIGCGSIKALFAPEGYIVTHLGGFDSKQVSDVMDFHFPSRNIGYALLNLKGSTRIYKTEDGGVTWFDTGVDPITSGRYIRFKDDNTGMVPLFGNISLITRDGGRNWIRKGLSFPNGQIKSPQYGEDGRLYGLQDTTMVVSNDDGSTWEKLYSAPELGSSSGNNFNFTLFEDKVYVNTKESLIYVLSNTGEKIEEINPSLSDRRNFLVLSEDTYIAQEFRTTLRSDDKGQTWDTIFNKTSEIIGFTDPEHGVMLQNIRTTPTDFVETFDLLASTDNGGRTWEEAEQTTLNARVEFEKSQKVDDHHYLMLYRNCLLEVYRLN